MRWTTMCVAATLAATSLSVGLPLAAAVEETPVIERGSVLEQQRQERRTQAEERMKRERERAAAFRAWVNPWGEAQRRAWDWHNAALRQAMQNRAAWDRAQFDGLRQWTDPWADAQRDWMERQADWQRQLADQQFDNLEKFMDAQRDWTMTHPIGPVWGVPYAGWW